jgi:NADPH:quinone reductase-like Zn-dependent oxidoreductase
MATFESKAAWIRAAQATPLEVGPGPTPNPSENEVVIKVAYSAVNPVDWKVREGVRWQPWVPLG